MIVCAEDELQLYRTARGLKSLFPRGADAHLFHFFQHRLRFSCRLRRGYSIISARL
jgi:hypothetical protein